MITRDSLGKLFRTEIAALEIWILFWGFPGGSESEESACNAGHQTWVQSLGQEDPLEKGMFTHPRIRVWRILHGQRSLMSMNVCVGVYICLCIIWVHVYKWVYVHVCVYVCVCVRTYVRMQCVYTHRYMCMYLWASQVAVVVKNLPANPRAAERRI